jgi:hypothetical protein
VSLQAAAMAICSGFGVWWALLIGFTAQAQSLRVFEGEVNDPWMSCALDSEGCILPTKDSQWMEGNSIQTICGVCTK